MTMQEMMSIYNAHSAAHVYLLGFIYEHMLYSIYLNFEQLSRYFKFDHMSSKRGGWAKIRIRMTSEQKLELSAKAELLGSETILDKHQNIKNRGHQFEKEMTERLTDEEWKADGIPFYVQGDINVNGEEIQIKFDTAELTNERCLKNLLESLA